jgi:hypothetical protein
MNKNSFQIFDNFLNQDYFEDLASAVLGDKFPWFYKECASADPRLNIPNSSKLSLETWGLDHTVYEKEQGVESFAFVLFEELFKNIERSFGFKFDQLIRARLGAKFPKIGFTSDNYNLPHIDYFYPHETLIFYFNDSDGDTRIFDQWGMYPMKNDFREDWPTEFTTQARVTPKANRLLWLNGLQFHTASNPIHTTNRVVINMNFKTL